MLGEPDYAELTRSIRKWADMHGRTPDWRYSRQPYPIAVAEVLLQKTKAADVLPVWRNVMSRCPTPAVLAAVPNDELFAMVAGLGLGTQRSMRLQKMSSGMIHGEPLSHLPGLGPYGTGVLCLSVGLEPATPPVDGNIARVISRLFGLRYDRGEPRKKPEVKEGTARILTAANNAEERLAIVYGLVDLGATVCTPKKPSCSICPLAINCHFAAHRRRLAPR